MMREKITQLLALCLVLITASGLVGFAIGKRYSDQGRKLAKAKESMRQCASGFGECMNILDRAEGMMKRCARVTGLLHECMLRLPNDTRLGE